MQESLQGKTTQRTVDEKIVRTLQEVETGVEEGTIEPGLHRYKSQYTITRHRYEPYEILITKSYGSYGMMKEGDKDYGNHR